MNKNQLHVFNNNYVEEMESTLIDDPNAIDNYKKEQMDIDNNRLLKTNLFLDEDVPVIDSDKNNDGENAIRIYNYLEGLNRTQATDKRLWTYMTHVTFRKYMMERWGTTNIIDHWFSGGGSKPLSRNGIARLWWGAKHSASPWEEDDSGYFESIRSRIVLYIPRFYSVTQIYFKVLWKGILVTQKKSLSQSFTIN